MEIIDVDYVEVPSEPITETWYTCPACGSLVATGKPCDCGYFPPPAESSQPYSSVLKQRKKTGITIFSIVVFILIVALVSFFYFRTPFPETPEERAVYRCCLDIQNALFFPSTFKLESDVGYYEFRVSGNTFKYVLVQYSINTQLHNASSGIGYYLVSDDGTVMYIGDTSVYKKATKAPRDMLQFYMCWNYSTPIKSIQIPVEQVTKWLNAST